MKEKIDLFLFTIMVKIAHYLGFHQIEIWSNKKKTRVIAVKFSELK
jgi:hypothetical protein